MLPGQAAERFRHRTLVFVRITDRNLVRSTAPYITSTTRARPAICLWTDGSYLRKPWHKSQLTAGLQELLTFTRPRAVRVEFFPQGRWFRQIWRTYASSGHYEYMCSRTVTAILAVVSFFFASNISFSKPLPRYSEQLERYGQLPLSFVVNSNSIPNSQGIRYLVNGPHLTAFFSTNEIVYRSRWSQLRLRFPGANIRPRLEGVGVLPGRASFFYGSDPKGWKSDVATYEKVAYRNLYPGIDMIYDGVHHHLKSQFIVAAGAHPDKIRMMYLGASQIRLDQAALVLETTDGNFRDQAPVMYQEIEGKRVVVSGAYHLFPDGSIGFDHGPYDRGRALIIDPVLAYSTYLGGDQPDSGAGIAIDTAGNAYITGWTVSANFPVLRGYSSSNSGGVDVFIAKLNPTGAALVYSTYLGGNSDDRGFGIAVDTAGNASVTGWTYSANFPTVSALQPRLAGVQNAFVAKLNAAGNALLYSTYLGGSGASSGTGIAVDAAGNAYVTGDTTSLNFPVVNAFHSSNAGAQDAFAAKFNVSGSALLYSTYVGGAQEDHASGIAVDSAGSAYIAGSTYSTNFPVVNALQPASGGGQDAFITKLNASGNGLLYSTYLGGSEGAVGFSEAALAIAVDSGGNAYVTGTTSSTNFPTVNALQPVHAGGGNDAFVAKLNPGGNTLIYSTYLGGSSLDFGTAIAVDSRGNAFVAGYTFSPDFPTTANAIQSASAGDYDAFFVKINPTGGALLSSTYLGGSRADSATGIAVDMTTGAAYITGQTLSGNFPTLNPFESSDTGMWSGFCAKILDRTTTKFAIFHNGFWSIDQNGNHRWDVPPTGDRAFEFGAPGDIAVVGDWTGDGHAKAGIFRGGAWSLDTNNNGVFDPGIDAAFYFGQPGDIPVVGDWNGDGRTKVGIFRNGLWALDVNGTYQLEYGIDAQFFFGQIGDTPVVGDWNGDGRSKAGIFRNGIWALDSNGSYQFEYGIDSQFYFGQRGDTPVVGDWSGNGRTKVGIFRNGLWALDMNGTGRSDLGAVFFYFGQAQDIPLVGDWMGDGRAKVGIFRNGLWAVDINGDGQWGPGDLSMFLGQAGDTPTPAFW